MTYRYERICKNAGLSEEQTKEVRKVFDLDRRRLKRRNDALETAPFVICYAADVDPEEDFEPDIPDLDFDLESEVIEKVLLEQLDGFLKEMQPEDREFLLACFSSHGAIKKLMEENSLTRSAVEWKRKKLIEELRKKFG